MTDAPVGPCKKPDWQGHSIMVVFLIYIYSFPLNFAIIDYYRKYI